VKTWSSYVVITVGGMPRAAETFQRQRCRHAAALPEAARSVVSCARWETLKKKTLEMHHASRWSDDGHVNVLWRRVGARHVCDDVIV